MADPASILTASSTGAAQANNCTLAASAGGQRTYICGFVITGGGATAASFIDVTVTGLLGGTATYKLFIPAGAATTPITPLSVHFSQPLPSSATNTAIVVNVPSFGAGNLHAAATAYGFLA